MYTVLRVKGHLINWKGSYGFLKISDEAPNIFLHITDVKQVILQYSRGKQVEPTPFVPGYYPVFVPGYYPVFVPGYYPYIVPSTTPHADL